MSIPTGIEETLPVADGGPQKRGKTIRAGRAISVVFFMSIAARLLSIVSQALTAAVFGTSREMDAYALALIVPYAIVGILATAVGAAIIPVFIEYRENHSETESMRLLWAATTLGAILAIIVTALMVAASPLIVSLFGRLDPYTQSLVVILLRFLMPILFLQSLTVLLGAILNAYGRFVTPSLAPALITLSIITFLLLGNQTWGIYALAWGTLVGYGLNLVVLVIAYLRLGLRFRLSLDWRHPGVRRIMVLSTPALLGALMINANPLVDQFIAAFLPAGSIASLSYAIKLVDTPSQFFYLALSTALLPVFSMQVARREFTLLRDTFRQVVVFSAMILLPAGALLGVLAYPVVQALLQRGHFSAGSTAEVAGAITLLAPSIFFVTYSFVNGRIYNALQDNWTLRNVAVLSLILNAVLDFLLMQVWGVAGIAFSTTLTYLIAAAVLLLILNRKLHGLNLPQLALSLGKTACAAALLWLACALLGRVPLVEQMAPLAQICLLGTVGCITYLVVLWGLRVPEMSQLWALLRRRLPLRRPAADAA